jgi:hypothetical protein
VTFGALAAGRVCGAAAVGGGNGLLCTAGLRLTDPVTSPGGALREENSWSLANREESELQLTRLAANVAVSAKRDQERERAGSVTLRMGLLTRLYTGRGS